MEGLADVRLGYNKVRYGESTIAARTLTQSA
jgi:hypothetical protein